MKITTATGERQRLEVCGELLISPESAIRHTQVLPVAPYLRRDSAMMAGEKVAAVLSFPDEPKIEANQKERKMKNAPQS